MLHIITEEQDYLHKEIFIGFAITKESKQLKCLLINCLHFAISNNGIVSIQLCIGSIVCSRQNKIQEKDIVLHGK